MKLQSSRPIGDTSKTKKRSGEQSFKTFQGIAVIGGTSLVFLIPWIFASWAGRLIVTLIASLLLGPSYLVALRAALGAPRHWKKAKGLSLIALLGVVAFLSYSTFVFSGTVADWIGVSAITQLIALALPGVALLSWLQANRFLF